MGIHNQLANFSDHVNTFDVGCKENACMNNSMETQADNIIANMIVQIGNAPFDLTVDNRNSIESTEKVLYENVLSDTDERLTNSLFNILGPIETGNPSLNSHKKRMGKIGKGLLRMCRKAESSSIKLPGNFNETCKKYDNREQPRTSARTAIASEFIKDFFNKKSTYNNKLYTSLLALGSFRRNMDNSGQENRFHKLERDTIKFFKYQQEDKQEMKHR